MNAARELVGIDYTIIAIYTVMCIFLGVFYTKRASKSTNEFFLTGRSMPWWLLGVSMAATNFSIDTPLAITKYVFQEGIPGVWFFWAFAITGIIATFFFATMWRRAEVMTDNEIVEMRYSGKSAAALRVFKGFYFGVIVNCFVMGWVFLAVIKVMTGLTNINPMWVLVISIAAVTLYSMSSGLYGVILTDFLQYGFALFGSFALAYFSVKGSGGLSQMLSDLHATVGMESGVTNFVPSFTSTAKWMPLNVFLVYILVQWWAYKYSDGGGKHIQRMSSAKNEKHATYATFFFVIVNYAIQAWPWILVALCAMVQFGRNVSDPEMTYVWMMGRWLPHGILGIVIVSLIAAFMSTISTHLNLGGSYMINDIYRRFLVKSASEKHYVLMSRVATLFTLAIAVVIALNMTSIGSAWKFILSFASGAGLTWVLRWFWWRLNAWSEFSAMITSGILATFLNIKYPNIDFGYNVLIIVGISTVVWVLVTYLTPPTDDETLRKFVQKIQPGSIGWNRIYKKYNIKSSGFSGQALITAFMGLSFFMAFNFGLGSLFLLKFRLAIILGSVAILSGAFLIIRVRKQNGSLRPSS